MSDNTIAIQQFVTAAKLKYRPNKHTATTTNSVTIISDVAASSISETAERLLKKNTRHKVST